MKKIILPAILLAILNLMVINAGAQSANKWRVNSNPNVSSDFSSLQDAIDNENVQDGDTLYLENGSHFGDITLNKSLVIIGPGYFLPENDSTHAHPFPALIQSIEFIEGSAGSKLTGVYVIGIAEIQSQHANDLTIERCYLGSFRTGGLSASGDASNLTIQQCYINGSINSSRLLSSIIRNNIVRDRIFLTSTSGSHQIVNNVINLNSTLATRALAARNSTVINNIIIREPESHIEYCIDFDADNNANSTFSKNLLTQSPDASFPDNLFNQVKEEIFILSGSTDGRWMLSEGSPALGYGINGDDSGAYGGPISYVLSGLPLLVPRIFEATIPASGSGTTIPVSIKVKTQEK